MDRCAFSSPFYCSAMRTDRLGSFDILLYTEHHGKRREPFPDAGDRQIVYRISILWDTTDYRWIARAWSYSQSQADRAFDARDGIGCGSTGSAHKQTAYGRSEISVSPPWKTDHQARRSMVCRYYLYPCASWLSVSGCNHGLVQSVCDCLGVIEYARELVLSSSTRDRLVLGNPGDIQHRSGVSIYEHGMDRSLAVCTDKDQHGRTGTRFGQRICRAALENAQV